MKSEFKENINEWLIKTQTPRYKYATEHLIDKLKIYNLKGKKVLDIGCGISYILPYIKGEKYGLDSSDKLLYLNEDEDAVFIKADALKSNLIFKKRVFDVVVVSSFIHHIPDNKYDAMFRKIKKLLKRDGKLILQEPNMISITGVYYKIRKVMEKIYKNLFIKMVGFSEEEERYLLPKEIRMKIERHFKIKKIKTIQFLRIPPIKSIEKYSVEPINKYVDKILDKYGWMIGTTLFIEAERK